MTDLRTRLAEALQRELDEHGYEDDDEKRGQVAHHFVDVLLSLDGIAIVELPEAETVDPLRWHDNSVTTVKGCGRVRCYLGDHRLPAGEARALAAALLAAANAAEKI